MKTPKIGVWICDCEGKISDKLDLDVLTSKAKDLENVTLVKRVGNLCSGKGLSELKKTIKENDVDRVLFAGCSARSSLKFSEELIAQILDEVGIDSALFEVANIREQNAWLHDDKDGATRKAIDLLRMAHARLKSDQPKLPPVKIVKKALVVGGGSTGIQAASDLAETGQAVTLVERAPYLGGQMCQVNFLFQSEGWPSYCLNECVGPVHSKKVAFNSEIDLLTNSEILNIEKKNGNFRVQIRKAPIFVDPEKCISCGFCAEVCPEETDNAFNFGFTKRKAIDKDFERAVPDTYYIIEEACTECGKCVDVCPTDAVNLKAEPEMIEDTFGSIILTTGFNSYDLSQNQEFSYSAPNVVSGIEMERIIEAEFKRPSDGKVPEHITFVLCGGSRATGDKIGEGVPYCSKTCCATTVKQAHRVGLAKPDIKMSVVYYHDVRTYERAFETFYNAVKNNGVSFVRGQISQITENTDNSLKVQIAPLNASMRDGGTETIDLNTDLVVIANAQLPETDTSPIFKQLKLYTDRYGFPMEFQPRIFKPTESYIDRVYVAGAINGPKVIQQSVEQGSTAAMKALPHLMKGEKELLKFVASIDKEKCTSCRICEIICPHGAIEITEEGAVVDPAFCQACGFCAAACPTHAAQLINFTDQQILDQVDVAFSELKEGEPKILALLCYWCSYGGADLAGIKGFKTPSNFRSIRIRCSSSVNSGLIMEMFKRGVDGILVAGCPQKSCHHLWGNYLADKRTELLKMLMRQLGLSDKRLRWEYLGVPDWIQFVDVITEMDKDLRELGPNLLTRR